MVNFLHVVAIFQHIDQTHQFRCGFCIHISFGRRDHGNFRAVSPASNQRYAIKRLDAGLTERQKQRIVEQVPSRLRKLYHTGFKYESSRQFCSKFVFDIYKEALCIPVGEIETFGELLNSNPNAKLTFWKFWFLGSIPWERKTVTPASLWHHPGLVLIHAEGVETPQPELTEAV